MLDKRSSIFVCSYMQNIYVIGGEVIFEGFSSPFTTASCMCFDIKSNKWTYTASMIESRYNASCAVFEGKVVVSGGRTKKYNDSVIKLKSDEAFCFHENKWTQLPDMLEERSGHGTVSMGNKLFIIGGFHTYTFEVFDSITNKFTYIESVPTSSYYLHDKYQCGERRLHNLCVSETTLC